VTHDPVDAAVLADQIVVIGAGRIVQTGPPAEITARPRSGWVAEQIGTNLFADTRLTAPSPSMTAAPSPRRQSPAGASVRSRGPSPDCSPAP